MGSVLRDVSAVAASNAYGTGVSAVAGPSIRRFAATQGEGVVEANGKIPSFRVGAEAPYRGTRPPFDMPLCGYSG